MILIAAAKILDLWRRDERKLGTIDLLKNAAIIRATITQEKSRETLEKLRGNFQERLFLSPASSD